MTKKLRILLLSFSAILLCVCMIIAGTFSLFSDSASITNHLRAGTLDVSLYRTDLQYTELNADGKLTTVRNNNKVDFTNATTENILGLTDPTTIVPGSWIEAEMELENSGNVAFDYVLRLRLKDGSDMTLAEQLTVTITDNAGQTTEKTLKAIIDADLAVITGSMPANATSQSFTVKVEFEDDDNNNAVQTKDLFLDLVVEATQST